MVGRLGANRRCVREPVAGIVTVDVGVLLPWQEMQVGPHGQDAYPQFSNAHRGGKSASRPGDDQVHIGHGHTRHDR